MAGRVAADRGAGADQRGISRAKDPAWYPLGCRLVDLTDGCGSVLYARTTHNRAVSTCGRYVRTSGAECASNQVDVEAMLRFTLKTLKQLVDHHGRRDKLRQKLLERARREAQEPAKDPREVELSRLRARCTELQAHCLTIEYRMSRERDDSLYDALARQYKGAKTELAVVEEAIGQQEVAQTTAEARSPEAQVEAALALLDAVTRISADPAVRAEVNALLQRLGLWIGLTFRPAVKGKVRVVQRLVSGRMVFGDGLLPVPLFGKDNVDDGPAGWRCRPAAPAFAAKNNEQEQGNPAADDLAGEPMRSAEKSKGSRKEKQPLGTGVFPVPEADLGDRSPDRLNKSQPEGISITKVSRGEKI